jgi:hypothetical protein
LRRGRERRGLSIGAAASGTRIREDYLRALENAAPVDAYPGPVYARYFAREYARYLGLNEVRVASAFEAGMAIGQQTPPTPFPHPIPSPPLTPADSRPAAPIRSAVRGPSLGAPRRSPALVVVLVALAVSIPSVAVVLRARSTDQGVATAGVKLANGSPAPGIIAASNPQALPTSNLTGSSDDRVVVRFPFAPPPLPELPGGGRVIFPDHRVVAYYGAPQSSILGVLGEGSPDQIARRLLDQSADYQRRGRPVIPAFELIASLATASSGVDGMYRFRQTAATIDSYLSAVRKIHGLLILDIQPGRADWLTEAKAFERWLREPDVSLALDPEWKLGPGDLPLHQIGSIDARSIDRVSRWLAGIVSDGQLPQKLLVVHEFRASMVTHQDRVKAREGLAITFDVDGFGSRAAKVLKWEELARGDHSYFHGMKLFYRHDPDLMSPKATLGLKPRPDLIVYQ